MWVARDKDNKVYIFNHKPQYNDNFVEGNCWIVKEEFGNDYGYETLIDMFPMVTFENSPVEFTFIESNVFGNMKEPTGPEEYGIKITL